MSLNNKIVDLLKNEEELSEKQFYEILEQLIDTQFYVAVQTKSAEDLKILQNYLTNEQPYDLELDVQYLIAEGSHDDNVLPLFSEKSLINVEPFETVTLSFIQGVMLAMQLDLQGVMINPEQEAFYVDVALIESLLEQAQELS